VDVKGGFFPYGWAGTISGSTTLVYSYVGYEVVASATEEAINAGRLVSRLTLWVQFAQWCIGFKINRLSESTFQRFSLSVNWLRHQARQFKAFSRESAD